MSTSRGAGLPARSPAAIVCPSYALPPNILPRSPDHDNTEVGWAVTDMPFFVLTASSTAAALAGSLGACLAPRCIQAILRGLPSFIQISRP